MHSRFIRWIVTSTQQFTQIWLIAIVLSCCLAAYFLQYLSLDTNIARLLPDDNPAAISMEKLRTPLGDGGYFTILLESDSRDEMIHCADRINEKVAQLSKVAFTSYRNPTTFIEQYKYSLLTSFTLDKMYEYVLELEAEYNPFSANLLEDPDEKSGREKNRQRGLEKQIDHLSSFTEYHESDDGRLLGIIVYPKSLITEFTALRKLHNTLETIVEEETVNTSVHGALGGSQIKNLREYKSIIEDLGRAGIISGVAIFLVLLFCFRNVQIIPVVVLPLLTGLCWSFAMVPQLVGPLNIITVFLLLILFGMGIDYSIHLIRSFQIQLEKMNNTSDALGKTLSSTGKAVLISGFTTALPLFVLALSDFRGFSDFGTIGGLSILTMLLAMFTVLPVMLIIGVRLSVITPGVPLSHSIKPPRLQTALLVTLLIVLSFAYTMYSEKYFDYNFSAHGGNTTETKQFNRNHKKVYKSSLVPAALYLAPDSMTLEKSLAVFNENMEQNNSTLNKVTSIRDYAPNQLEFEKRLELLAEIRATLQGSWYKKIDSPEIRSWIEDFRGWRPPARAATLVELPEAITQYYLSRDDSQQYLIGLYPSGSRRNGKEVLAFQEELEGTELPKTLQGPVGENILFAEILSIVLSEAPIVLFVSLLVVALPIFIAGRSLPELLYTLFPLLSGMAMLFGVMGLTGMQVNYLSIVALPALLGLGVDDGVHYYQHCKEANFDVHKTHGELFGTLSICTLTTMIGYFGLIVASNKGLQSLGQVASLGMACLWFTSLFLLPALLRRENRLIQ